MNMNLILPIVLISIQIVIGDLFPFREVDIEDCVARGTDLQRVWADEVL
jgi:hypothetical protein